MKYTFFLSILFLTTDMYSQSISGMVRENEKPLAQVNISLLDLQDSLLKKTAITDDNGYYKIESIEAGTYILKASRVGYRQQFLSAITIKPDGDELVLPVLTFIPMDRQLDEVTVTGRRPFIEQKIDRMVVNVANTVVSSGTNALDVLEKTPGIIIDRQNDQILFRGKEGVILQIDGKQTYLSMADAIALLRSMPAENIDRIELITNPSARYDAAGNSGIIDIRLKKNNNIGTNGNLSMGIGTGRYGRQVANLQINHRTQKLNSFGNFAASRDGNYWNFDIHKKQPDGPGFNFIHQLSPIRFKNHGQNAKAGLDYFINKKLTAGIVWTGFWNSSHEKSPAEAFFRKQKDGEVYLQTLTDKTLSNVQSNHLFNLNIVHALARKSQISVDLDLGSFRRKFSNSLVTDTIIPGPSGGKLTALLSKMPTTINIFSFRVDYTGLIRDKWKVEAGIKAVKVRSDNDLQLSTGPDDSLVPDPVLSNHFKYQEVVKAGYISLSGKIVPHTEVMLGLRAEHTHSIGNSITQNNKVVKDYLNFFPSVFITHPLNKNHTLSFSYSYRIDRPNYQSLNPARSYIDPYAYTAGNPFLTPQFTHSLELKHGFKNKIFTSLGASYISDLVFYTIVPIDEKTTERIPENIGKGEAYNFTVSFPVKVMKGWTMQNSILGIYNRFKYHYRNTIFHAEQITGRLNSAHSFVFGKGWTAEMSGRLSSPGVNVLVRNPWLGSMDLGLQKIFTPKWKGRLSLQDVFHTTIVSGRINVPGFESSVRITRDTRIVMLTIIHSFGNQQLKSSRQRKTASEEEIQRTN